MVIVVFFLVYTASALASGGKLFNTVFGVDYHIALLIGTAVILIYTFMGGFLAVCTTDFVQGSLMLVGILVVPIIQAYNMLDGDMITALSANGISDTDGYLSMFLNNGSCVLFQKKYFHSLHGDLVIVECHIFL